VRFWLLRELLRRYRCPILMREVDAVVLPNPQPLSTRTRISPRCTASKTSPGADIGRILVAPIDLSLDYFDLVRRYIGIFFGRFRNMVSGQVALRAAGRRIQQRESSDTRLSYFRSLHMIRPNNTDT
jgi:hypothetical protein